MFQIRRLRLKKVHGISLVAAAVFIALFQNCGDKMSFQGENASSAPISPVGGAGSGIIPQNSCQTGTLSQLVSPVKVLMIVDASKSNEESSGGVPATDPGKTHRLASINQFFAIYGARTNFSWGFEIFQGSSAYAFVNQGSRSQPTFGNSTAMQSAIQTFKTWSDQSYTPYHAALAMATNVLANDSTYTSDTKYILFFLSDGMPTDADKDDAKLSADVQALMATHPNQISLNTIFYGGADADASGRLASMASLGHGQFLDASANPNMLDTMITGVVTVPGSNCQ